jgi:hypothetical protein
MIKSYEVNCGRGKAFMSPLLSLNFGGFAGFLYSKFDIGIETD